MNSRSIGEFLGRGDEESIRLAGFVLLVEDLRQGDGLPMTLIDEHAEEDGVRRVIAQADRARRTRSLDALGLVVALDIAAQRSLLGLGSGCLVVRDLLGGKQQGRDRIDEGGFPATDVTGEQCGLAPGSEPPNPLVEGAPVEDFEVVQPIAGAAAGLKLDR